MKNCYKNKLQNEVHSEAEWYEILRKEVKEEGTLRILFSSSLADDFANKI